eukprot:3387025-Rhodomonas_salina.4
MMLAISKPDLHSEYPHRGLTFFPLTDSDPVHEKHDRCCLGTVVRDNGRGGSTVDAERVQRLMPVMLVSER